jgi:hypothetical protein
VIEVIDSISGEQARQIDVAQHATPLVTKKDRVSCPLWEWLTRHLPVGGSKLGGDQRAVGTQVVGKTSIETQQERPIREQQMEGFVGHPLPKHFKTRLLADEPSM